MADSLVKHIKYRDFKKVPKVKHPKNNAALILTAIMPESIIS
jgi:hypothetical protein